MSTTDFPCGPIGGDWTTTRQAATVELIGVLAARSIESLGPWHAELAAAVDELHRDRIGAESVPGGAVEVRWGVEDPIVALVRAASLLARRHPTASSPTAGLLVELLACDPDVQSESAS